MDYLVRILILSTLVLHNCLAQERLKKSLFSWGEEAEVKEQAVMPGYHPPVTVHKYHGVEINPLNGPPTRILSSNNPEHSEQGAPLPPEYLDQLSLLRRVVSFLPNNGDLQDYDLTGLLPYVELIPEDALDRIQYTVEVEKSQNESKLAKLINFIKYLRDLKLKPIRAAVNLGANLLSKKKKMVSNLLHLGSPAITTPLPVLPPPDIPQPGEFPIPYPTNRPPIFVPNLPSSPPFPIEQAPQEGQLQQPDPQPVAAPSGVNTDNRFDPNYGQLPGHPRLTPANNYLYYPVASHPQSIQPPNPYYYPQQPSFLPQGPYPGNNEPSRAQYQQSAGVSTNLYPKDPSKFSVPTFQNSQFQDFSAQERRKNPLTPASTYLLDLTGSASQNVEKVIESSAPAEEVQEEVNAKQQQSVTSEVNQVSETSPKPRRTRLRPVEARPPIQVFPDNAAQSKPVGE